MGVFECGLLRYQGSKMPLKPITDGPAPTTRHGLRGSLALLVVAVACFAIAGVTGLALARTTPTLSRAKNSTIGKTIVVDSRGLTVYELSPETTHHLLCTKAKGCFKVWPPVTVPTAKTKITASGVNGKLGTLHRNGFFQLTLGGRPLYHFFLDASKRGSAKGQGIHSFGGSWHVVAASAAPTTTTTTTTTTPYPPY